MRHTSTEQILALALCGLFSAICMINAVPLPAGNQELDMLQIPLDNGKELDVLTLGGKEQEQSIADRNKRTIGLLRELFPDITKEIDSIVNRIIAQVIRVAGPGLLNSILVNNRGGGGSTTASPDFDADFDDDDDDDDDSSSFGDDNKDANKRNDNGNGNGNASNAIDSNNDSSTQVKIDLPTFAPDTEASSAANKVSARESITNVVSSTSPSPSPTTTTTTSTTTSSSFVNDLTTIISPSPSPTTTTTTTSTTTSSSFVNDLTTIMPSPSPSGAAIDEPVPDQFLPRFLGTEPTTSSTITTTTTTNEIPTSVYPTTTTTNIIPTSTTPNNFTTSNQLNAHTFNIEDSQFLTIIQDINRVLNSTNYFITTRDNLTTTTTMATTNDNHNNKDHINQNGATDTQIDLSAINKQLEETIRVARQVKEAEAAAAAVAAQAASSSPIAQAPIPLKTTEQIQLSFNNELPTLNIGAGSSSSNDVKALNSNDLQLSESKSPAIDELTLDSAEETADLDDRNKRFLSFGGAGLAGGSSGGAGAAAGGGNGLASSGSGNFLLDVVRLFSGSVQTQQGDEAANSVGGGSSGSSDDADANSDSQRTADGYTEGIPGPVTRLVVLANRGLANLVQDLILRVAATSEKFVNFKAKLITALI